MRYHQWLVAGGAVTVVCPIFVAWVPYLTLGSQCGQSQVHVAHDWLGVSTPARFFMFAKTQSVGLNPRYSCFTQNKNSKSCSNGMLKAGVLHVVDETANKPCTQQRLVNVNLCSEKDVFVPRRLQVACRQQRRRSPPMSHQEKTPHPTPYTGPHLVHHSRDRG